MVALVIAALALGTQAARTPAPAEALGPIQLQQVAGGFSQITNIVHAGDERLFITEKSGRIKVLVDGTTYPTPFLNVQSLLSPTPANEEGLLGLAFHPDYPSTPYFYIHYNNPDGDIVIARYSVSSNPNVADPGSGVILMTISHPGQTNHNGGRLEFGPDGYLYIAIGDGGGANDPPNNAQNLNTKLGKILRLDVDQNVGTPPYYGIPASNPFAGATPGDDAIWAWGLRNPWRISFDRVTGDLLIGDVGQEVREEIDFQPAASAGGENYGWRIMEGFDCHMNEGVGCFDSSLTPPVLDYDQSAGDCSVTGGYMYRGMSTSFVGEYIFGDFCSGRIWHATPGTAPWPRTLLLDAPYLISTFGEDVNGELYLADWIGGTVQRLLLEDGDGDTVFDQADNCPDDANASQANNDRNFVDQTPPAAVDDGTWINSDNMGDDCDPDDDNDGLTDAQEVSGCNGSGALSATNRDTDGDRFLDGAECALGTNPGSAASLPPVVPPGDTDNDGLSSTFEATIGTNPSDPDSDDDGLRDGLEYRNYNSDPLSANTDSDACSDGREVASINVDATVSSGDQGLLAAEMARVPPPPKAVNIDRYTAAVARAFSPRPKLV
jgi:glucose/arabinose dehydrogenase